MSNLKEALNELQREREQEMTVLNQEELHQRKQKFNAGNHLLFPAEVGEGVACQGDMRTYQLATNATAIYPHNNTGNAGALAYAALGLAGEAGEVANKVKKILRDHSGSVTEEKRDQIKKELGDVLWYWARLCEELNLDPNEVMDLNLNKLLGRKEKGTLQGDGDER